MRIPARVWPGSLPHPAYGRSIAVYTDDSTRHLVRRDKQPAIFRSFWSGMASAGKRGDNRRTVFFFWAGFADNYTLAEHNRSSGRYPGRLRTGRNADESAGSRTKKRDFYFCDCVTV